jgi:hypothetical protein
MWGTWLPHNKLLTNNLFCVGSHLALFFNPTFFWNHLGLQSVLLQIEWNSSPFSLKIMNWMMILTFLSTHSNQLLILSTNNGPSNMIFEHLQWLFSFRRFCNWFSQAILYLFTYCTWAYPLAHYSCLWNNMSPNLGQIFWWGLFNWCCKILISLP